MVDKMSFGRAYNKVLGKVFLGNEAYDRLRDFFVSSWSARYDDANEYQYRVYLAQKCLNLNEMFYQTESAEEVADIGQDCGSLSLLRGRTFISQTALLLKAREYAEVYRESGEFPKTLIVDELAITGHDFCELLFSLESLILEELEEKERLSDDEEQSRRSAVHDALVRSIRFFVYLRKDDLLLMDRSLRSVIFPADSDNNIEIGDIYRFALGVSSVITLSPLGVNTSFTPSFLLDRQDYDGRANDRLACGWRCEEWRYRGIKAGLWQTSICDAENRIRAHASVFCRYHSVDEAMCITPYLFWNGISDEGVYRIFDGLSRQISAADRETFRPFLEILDCRQRGMLYLQMQFLSTLASFLLFYAFIGFEEYDALASSCDIEKTAQCYGTLEEMLPAFELLCAPHSGALRKELWQFLCSALEWNAGTLGLLAEERDLRCDHARYLLRAENFFSGLDRSVRHRRWQRHMQEVQYAPWSDFGEDNSALTDYLSAFPSEMESLDRKLGALLMLLRHGLAGWSTHVDSDSMFSLKVGEATGSIAVMHMYRFFPALTGLERICESNDLSTPAQAERFGAYLDQKYGTGNLRGLFQAFVSGIYDGGMHLRDWDIDYRLWLDRPDFSDGVRTLQEWTEKPWPEDEKAELSALSDREEYLRWEEKKQRLLYKEVPLFFSKID